MRSVLTFIVLMVALSGCVSSDRKEYFVGTPMVSSDLPHGEVVTYVNSLSNAEVCAASLSIWEQDALIAMPISPNFDLNNTFGVDDESYGKSAVDKLLQARLQNIFSQERTKLCANGETSYCHKSYRPADRGVNFSADQLNKLCPGLFGAKNRSFSNSIVELVQYRSDRRAEIREWENFKDRVQSNTGNSMYCTTRNSGFSTSISCY